MMNTGDPAFSFTEGHVVCGCFPYEKITSDHVAEDHCQLFSFLWLGIFCLSSYHYIKQEMKYYGI